MHESSIVFSHMHSFDYISGVKILSFPLNVYTFFSISKVNSNSNLTCCMPTKELHLIIPRSKPTFFYIGFLIVFIVIHWFFF